MSEINNEKENMQELIELYALGELDDEKIPGVEKYLRDNPVAMDEFKSLREIMSAVSSVEPDSPPPALAMKVRRDVHAMMERRAKRPAILIFITDFFRKPVYAAVTGLAVMAIALAITFALVNSGTQVVDNPESETPVIVSPVGKAGTLPADMGEYVSESVAVFRSILDKDAEDIRHALAGRDITVDVGKAMSLMERGGVSSDPVYSALIMDIEAVWRGIMAFTKNEPGTGAERITSDIKQRRIIQRALELGLN